MIQSSVIGNPTRQPATLMPHLFLYVVDIWMDRT